MANANILLNGLDAPRGVDSVFRGFAQGEQVAQAPMRNRLLEAQTTGAEQTVDRDKAIFQMRDMAQDAFELQNVLNTGDMNRSRVFLANRIKKIQDRGGDASDTIGLMQQLESGDVDGVKAELAGVLDMATQFGVIGRNQSTAYKEFEAKAAAAGLKPGTPDYELAARVDLGLDARASLSADERIAANQETTDAVAGSRATIKGAEAGAAEEAKMDVRAAKLPNIQAAIKAAEIEAKDRGETLTAYKRAKAGLPGLMEVTDKLRKLADVATFTTKGRFFNAAAKELGFSTEGGTARSTMTAVVDNQVLPLLRETFGAAFTKAEGDSLRSTLLDINATPDSKKATLDAFIEQKMRNLEAQESELGSGSAVDDLVNKYAD